MRLGRIALSAVAIALLAACSFENSNERQAERLTRAVIGNNLAPVENDIAKGVAVTRVKVAEWSDELNEQGKLISVKETPEKCAVGWHCFRVKFEKHVYDERMRLDEHGKVVDWRFHMAEQQ